MKRLLAAVGDPNDIATWSGTPYHLLIEARSQGVLDAGLPMGVDAPVWRRRRVLWNLLRVIQGFGRGGYQYSDGFLEALWRPHTAAIDGAILLNCFQLYPRSVVLRDDVARWYFIDQTLTQMFETYGARADVGRGVADAAVEAERAGYHRAAGVIAHSRWAAESLTDDYGVAQNRVHVVVPGANTAGYNLDELPGARKATDTNGDRVLRLVFVGKDPQRKGLDRLLRAIAIATGQGAPLHLRVIGCARETVAEPLRATLNVEWVGFIDKRTDAARYAELVGGADVGCLLSRAEAGGIGLREYHALGLAVIAPDVGGSPDHVIPEASILVRPDQSDADIAATLVALSRDRERVAAMKAVSWARRHEVLWTESVRRIGKILDDARETVTNHDSFQI